MKKAFLSLFAVALMLVVPRIGRAQCPPDQNTCLITVLCGDMMGDGWNGGALQVWQDTVLRGSVSLLSGYQGTFDVLVCSDDTMRFVWIAGPLDYEISFSVVSADGSPILAETYAGGISSGTIVALAMPSCPSCVRPVDLVCHADSTSATISWTPIGTESMWLIYLNDSLYTTAYTIPQFITGLSINTDYTVGIRALCSTTDTSQMLRGSFRTSCPPVPIPYYNTFDGEPYEDIPSCWSPVITFGDYPKVFDEDAFSDSLSLSFGASGWNVLATPLVDAPGNQLNVTFRAKLENGINIGSFNLFNSRLRVGVISDLNDTSSFIPMVDISSMDDTWRDYEFNTSTLSPDARYHVAFFFHGDDIMFGNGFVDDLGITVDNGCRRPDYVRVDSIGSRLATLSWNAVSDSCTGYHVYYSTDNNALTAQYYTFVSDTTVTIHGLDQATTYYVWVRTACGDDTSVYRSSLPFTTQMTCFPVSDVQLANVHFTAAVLSWTCDYLNGNPTQGAWVSLYDRADLATSLLDTFVYDASIVLTNLLPGHAYRAVVRNICAASSDADTANAVRFDFMTNSCTEATAGGQQSSPLYFVNTNLTNSYAQTLYLDSELQDIDTIRGIAYRTSTGVLEPLDFSLYMGNTNLSALAATTYLPADSLTPVAVNHVLYPSSSEWQVIYFNTPFVRDTLRNLVVAVHHSNNHFFFSPAAWYYHPTAHASSVMWSSFSPISMAAPSSQFGATVANNAADVRFIADCSVEGCMSPMVVGINPDSTAISLVWINAGTPPSGYVVQYKPASASRFVTSATVTSLSHTISGLSPASRYHLRVGALCEGDTLWNQVTATTDCGQIRTPYEENFDSYADAVMPPCWRYNRAIVSHQYGGLFWQPSPVVSGAVLPSFDLPVNRLELNFRVMMNTISSGEAILVGVTDEDGSFIDWVDTLTSPLQSLNRYTWFRHDFSGYSGSGSRIVLAHRSSQSEATLVDDISVSEAVGCLPVDHIEAHNLADASNITVSWARSSSASQWQLAWDTLGTDRNAMLFSATVSDTFYTLPPLVSGGRYTVYVRALCGAGQSAWRSLDFAAGTIIMSRNATDTVSGCGLVIYDDGGEYYDYSNNNVSTLVVRPSDPNMAVQIHGGVVSLSPWGRDSLFVYEGEGTGGALLYSVAATYGPQSIGSVIASEVGPITILFVSDNDGTSSGYEIYTSCVPVSPCRRPTDVSVNVTSPTSATVSWVASALAFDVKYRAQGATAWQTASTSANTIVLNGLSSGTDYQLFVQGFCSDNQVSPTSATIHFRTLCDAVTVAAAQPLDASFEEPEAPAPCFSMLSAPGNNNTMQHSTERAFDGVASFRFGSYQSSSDYNQYLISPLLSTRDSLTLRFRYSDLMYGQEKLRVGYSTTGNAPQDFIWTDTLTTNGIVWKRYAADFPSNTRFLAINYCSQWRYFAFVDSLRISVVASADCQAPIITDLNETPDSITVHFIADGTVEAYITDQPWNDNVSGFTVSGTSHTFTGLAPNTQYTIGLRNHCSSGISSHWTTRNVVTTIEDCPPPTAFSLDDNRYTSATFSWQGEAQLYEINIFNTVYNRSFTVSSNSFTVEGLYSDYTYNAKIRSLCDGLPGRWADTVITFTTAECPAVTNLESRVLNAQEGSVLLTWQSQVGNYVLEYGEEHYSAGSGTTIAGITDEHYRLDGITTGVTYDYYVRAQCDTNVFSIFSERGVFTVTDQGVMQPGDALSVRLYPNPATGSTTIAVGGAAEPLTVEVVDINGRILRRQHHRCPDGCQIRFDLAALPRGVYFLRLTGATVNHVEKFIVE